MSLYTVGVRELRPKLPRILRHVSDRFDRYVVTKRGKPEAVILSVADYESLLETLDLERDAAALDRLRLAEAERKRGRGKRLSALHKELGLPNGG
ncbi:MAG: type II toxin-antitoxin system Phd/YefM family antitoxin [Candidatus Omnitrophica bacterium]|nr:type II toxin-antitoxin system Phd/YefM family antitoxin [Candidatus Omnitrophota bacterium]